MISFLVSLGVVSVVFILMEYGVVVADRRYDTSHASPEPGLNSMLRQPVLPFDKNLAAIGVLEPEFHTMVDPDKQHEWAQKLLMGAKTLGVDYVEIRDSCGQLITVFTEAYVPEAEWCEAPPTKTELRWRNTLLDSPAP